MNILLETMLEYVKKQLDDGEINIESTYYLTDKDIKEIKKDWYLFQSKLLGLLPKELGARRVLDKTNKTLRVKVQPKPIKLSLQDAIPGGIALGAVPQLEWVDPPQYKPKSTRKKKTRNSNKIIIVR